MHFRFNLSHPKLLSVGLHFVFAVNFLLLQATMWFKHMFWKKCFVVHKKSFNRKVGEMCAFLLVPVPWKIHPINQHFLRLPCQTRMKKKSDHLDEVHGKYFLSKAYTTWKIYFVASANRMNLLPSWSERNLSHFYLRCLVSALKNCHRLKPFAVRRVIEVFDITCQ